MATTSWPASTSVGHNRRPTKPDAPATSTFIGAGPFARPGSSYLSSRNTLQALRGRGARRGTRVRIHLTRWQPATSAAQRDLGVAEDEGAVSGQGDAERRVEGLRGRRVEPQPD